jgi:hypothetical protein
MISPGAYVVELQTDEIASSELAVDRKVEQGEISFPTVQLKPNSNGPDLFRLQRALLADEAGCSREPASKAQVVGSRSA